MTSHTGAAGVVYTRPWVVNLILDLARFDPTTDIVAAGPVVEPACGDGAFLPAIVDRLVRSSRKFGHPSSVLDEAIIGLDIDAAAVQASRQNAHAALRAHRFTPKAAERITRRWIRRADFLDDTPDIHNAGWVLGNPPYVRIEQTSKERTQTYRRRWPTMTGRSDIYVGFIEAGLSLLGDGGRLAYICPDRWMHNTYGKHLRAHIAAGFDLETIVSMHGIDAFFHRVDAYPATVVIRRGEPARPFVAEVSAELSSEQAEALVAAATAARTGRSRLVSKPTFRYRRPIGWPAEGGSWSSPLSPQHDLVTRLEGSFPTLAETGITVRAGVATGADDVFIVDDLVDIEPDRLEPVISAAEIVDGTIRSKTRNLVNPWSDHGLVDLSQYPRLSAYLHAHETRLRDRRTARDNPQRWWKTIDRVDPRVTSTAKLLIPDVKDAIHPVIDTGKYQPMHNLYYLTAPDWDLAVLGGLLLSDTVEAFIRAYSVKMASGYMRVSAQYLRRIRIPPRSTLDGDIAESLADAFRSRDQRAASVAAAEAYGLEL